MVEVLDVRANGRTEEFWRAFNGLIGPTYRLECDCVMLREAGGSVNLNKVRSDVKEVRRLLQDVEYALFRTRSTLSDDPELMHLYKKHEHSLGNFMYNSLMDNHEILRKADRLLFKPRIDVIELEGSTSGRFKRQSELLEAEERKRMRWDKSYIIDTHN